MIKWNIVVGIVFLIVGLFEFWGIYNAYRKLKTGQFKPTSPFMPFVFYTSVVVGCFALFGAFYATFLF